MLGVGEWQEDWLEKVVTRGGGRCRSTTAASSE
jgi:hypothetical protein